MFRLKKGAERENTRAEILRLQAASQSTDTRDLTALVKALKQSYVDLLGHELNDAPEAFSEVSLREKLSCDVIPAIKDLMLTCGMEEVF